MEELVPKVKQINHVAVVVPDMEKALSFWRDALGVQMHELRDVPAEKSQVAFLPLPVIPHLKISDGGMVDVDKFALIG